VADTVGGLTAAMAICGALNAQPRGSFIDVAMLDSLVATMGWAVSNLLIAGVDPVPAGNENLTASPSAAYACADGPLNIAANKQEQWEKLADHLGLSHMKTDTRFQTRAARRANRRALNDALEEVLITRASAEWEEELNAQGIPAGRILSMREVLHLPAYRARDQVATYELGDGREVEVIRSGIHMDGAPLEVSAPPSELGAETDEILTEIGLDAKEISELRAAGIV
jgi:formyl-CoA transferase